MVNHLVIVAGGKGTRLTSLSVDLPKVLVPVGGKPVLQHQLELAAASGIEQVTIFAGHLAEKIVSFVGDGSRFGLKVQVLVEETPLGNAGALLQNLNLLSDQFFVLYGDVMLAVDLQRIAKDHIDREAHLTAFVHPNDHPHDSDLIETDSDNWVTGIHTYPHPPGQFFDNLVNAALYVVSREAIRPWAGLSGKHDFTKDLIPNLLTEGGRVLAYRSSEYIKDMGTPDRLIKVDSDYRAGKLTLKSRHARPAVFLDRDGTLNVEKGFLRRWQDLELIPGAAAALRSLRKAGFELVVLTNQPVIARGEATEADVAAIHRRLEWELGRQGAYVDGIYYCPHHPDRGFEGERPELKTVCRCRKPATGLLEDACQDLHVDLARSWMIGDRTADMELARRAGLRSVLVRTGASGRDERFPSKPDHIASDIGAAADFVSQQFRVAA